MKQPSRPRLTSRLGALITQLRWRQATDRLRSLAIYRAFFRIVGLIFLSLGLTFFMFRAYYGEFDLERFQWFFQPDHNHIFMVSWLIIFLVSVWLFAIFQSVIIASGSLAAILSIWLFVNQVKITSRQTPFLPEDLLLIGEARQVASVVNPQELQLLLTRLVLIAMMLGAGLILRALIGNFNKPSWRARLLTGISLLTISSFGLLQVAHQIKNPATILKKDNFIGNDLISWNQQVNYHWNGPVIGFVYNIGKLELIKPPEYSQQRIAQIVKRYQAAAQHNKRQRPLTIDHQSLNLALVLSESMILPTQVADVYPLRHNPMPWLTSYIAQHPHNYLQLATSEYGGGTANVEFEVLTSFSTTLNQNATPFTNLLPKLANFPSLAQRLGYSGAQTSAMHNFHPEMYKRNLTYPNLGFNQFDGVEDFKHRSTIENNPYDSDRSFYQQLYDKLAAQPQRTKFINGVTMQNHAPYDGFYRADRQFAESSHLTTDQHRNLENYYTGLAYTDQALAEFYQKLQQLPQKTLVVIYGDHFPGSDVLGKVNEVDAARAHLTPIVLLANFPLPNHQLPTIISGNYLTSHLSDLLGWSKSGFDMLLQDLRQQFPKLSFYHSQQPGEFRHSQAYRDYELIQYDLLNGQRFSQKMGFFDAK